MPETGTSNLPSFQDLQAMREQQRSYDEWRAAAAEERERERRERLARVVHNRPKPKRGRPSRRDQIAQARRVVQDDGTVRLLLPAGRTNRKWSDRMMRTTDLDDNITGTSSTEAIGPCVPWSVGADEVASAWWAVEGEPSSVTRPQRWQLVEQLRDVRLRLRIAQAFGDDRDVRRLLYQGWTLADRIEGR